MKVNFYVIMRHYEYEDNSEVLGVHYNLSSALKQLNMLKQECDLQYKNKKSRSSYNNFTLDIVTMKADKEENCLIADNVKTYIDLFVGWRKNISNDTIYYMSHVDYIIDNIMVKGTKLECDEKVILEAEGGY